MIFLLSLFIRVCIDESKLCKGVPLCDNKEDLKWCKAASNWTVPDNWTPMYNSNNMHLEKKCTTLNDTDPQGQWIDSEDKTDGIFQCINRKDENPFSKQKNVTDGNSWIELVNSTCDDLDKRRCLGHKPTQCVSK